MPGIFRATSPAPISSKLQKHQISQDNNVVGCNGNQSTSWRGSHFFNANVIDFTFTHVLVVTLWSHFIETNKLPVILIILT